MTKGADMSGSTKSLPMLAATALVLLAATSAQADTVMAKSGLITGTEALDFSFQVPGPGTIDLLLSDLDWPTPLSGLDISATSPTAVFGSMTRSGDLSFKVSTAGTYYAHLIGEAQGSLDIGAYSLKVSYTSAVPLPASLWMLLGGLGLLGVALRHRAALPLATSA